MDTITAAPVVGQTFFMHTERRWQDETGHRLHRYSQRMVVTGVSEFEFAADVVALVDETGRPSWATSRLGEGSLIALLGVWHLRLESGEFTLEVAA